MLFLPNPIYKVEYQEYNFANNYELQGVKFFTNRIIGENGYMEGLLMKIKSIEDGNIAFLSVGHHKTNMNIIKNRIISKGDIISFYYGQQTSVELGITSYNEWYIEQKILTNSSDFNKIIQSKIMAKTSDINLIVNSGERKEDIKCHSSHLCIKSPHFFNLLESVFAESESAGIEIHCSKEAVIPILQYIYTGEIDEKFFTKANYETVLEMYSKVCEYQMEKVKTIVEVFILAYLEENNVKLLFQSAILNRDDPFTMKAIKFIATKFSQL